MMKFIKGNSRRSTAPASCAMALMLVMLFLIANAAHAAAANDRRVSVGSLSYASVIPNEDGLWQTNRKAAPALVGEREYVSLPIIVGSDVRANEKLRISIECSNLDLSSAELAIIFENDGVYLLRELQLNRRKSKPKQLSSELSIEGQFLNTKTKATLLFSAVRLKEGGSVDITLSKPAPSSMTAGTALRVGEYSIRKQGKGTAAVENAVGLSGMIRVETVYIISKAEQELIRVMIEGGEVLGLAISDGGMVAGVEYDVDRKIYVNVMTQKQVLTKDQLIEIFSELNFSFLRLPDESKWLSQQDSYSWSKSLTF